MYVLSPYRSSSFPSPLNLSHGFSPYSVLLLPYFFLIFLFSSFSHLVGTRVEGGCSDNSSPNPWATPCCLLICSYNTHLINNDTTHMHTLPLLEKQTKGQGRGESEMWLLFIYQMFTSATTSLWHFYVYQLYVPSAPSMVRCIHFITR